MSATSKGLPTLILLQRLEDEARRASVLPGWVRDDEPSPPPPSSSDRRVLRNPEPPRCPRQNNR